jgi:predicted amidohydrolase YtcJ
VAGLLVDDGVVVDLAPTSVCDDVDLLVLGDQQWVQPGYRDEHVHLMSMAAVGLSLDVSPAADLDEMLAMISAAPGTGWTRVWGYDEGLMAERSQLTASVLDAITDLPTVVHHRTGHVAIVNTTALRLLGEGPADGVLVEQHELLSRVPPLDPADLLTSLGSALDEMATRGIVGCTDATHTNGLPALEFLSRAAAPNRPGITAMVGADRLDSLDGRQFGDLVDSVEIGHAKVMPPLGTDGAIHELVRWARSAGFPVGVHVMDIDTLAVALGAFGEVAPDGSAVDRIEHCALALPEQLDAIAEQGLMVVTQPSFVIERQAKYERSVSEVERRWLWPLASLAERGIPVRYSSDAPVVPSWPAEWIEAATHRTLGSEQRVTADVAEMHATGGTVIGVGTPLEALVVGTDGVDGRRFERLGVRSA